MAEVAILTAPAAPTVPATATTAATATQSSAPATATTASPAVTAAPAAPATAETKGTLIGGDVTATETTYKLELPKDSLLGPDAIERTTATARMLGLSEEQAKAVLKHEADGVKAYADRQQAEYQKLPDLWLKEVEADKEVGGDKLKENVQLVKAFSTKWLSKETREFLNVSGFGNKLELFKDLVKLARANAPDKPVHGQTTSLAKPKTDFETMFPASVGGQKAEGE